MFRTKSKILKGTEKKCRIKMGSVSCKCSREVDDIGEVTATCPETPRRYMLSLSDTKKVVAA